MMNCMEKRVKTKLVNDEKHEIDENGENDMAMDHDLHAPMMVIVGFLTVEQNYNYYVSLMLA